MPTATLSFSSGDLYENIVNSLRCTDESRRVLIGNWLSENPDVLCGNPLGMADERVNLMNPLGIFDDLDLAPEQVVANILI